MHAAWCVRMPLRNLVKHKPGWYKKRIPICYAGYYAGCMKSGTATFCALARYVIFYYYAGCTPNHTGSPIVGRDNIFIIQPVWGFVSVSDFVPTLSWFLSLSLCLSLSLSLSLYLSLSFPLSLSISIPISISLLSLSRSLSLSLNRFRFRFMSTDIQNQQIQIQRTFKCQNPIRKVSDSLVRIMNHTDSFN